MKILSSKKLQMHTLPDRRFLGFAEYGDPDGNALFYFYETLNNELYSPSPSNEISA